MRLIERLRVDQIADGFGLGQIDAAVEEGAHGEFAGLGEARAARQRQLDYVAQDDGRAVAGDFDDVVGGVGVRLGEVGDDDFVDAVACVAGSISSPKWARLGWSSSRARGAASA